MTSLVGDRVRALRLQRAWTQAELARELGLSQARLSEIERGHGSFTAEQFITILGLFNVPVSHFAPSPSPDPDAGLQNALAHLGANHLQLTPHSPSDRAMLAGDAVREALLTGSPRMVTALAPVLVRNAARVSLARVDASLRDAGLHRRLPWLVDNVVEALRDELARWLRSSSPARRGLGAAPPGTLAARNHRIHRADATNLLRPRYDGQRCP